MTNNTPHTRIPGQVLILLLMLGMLSSGPLWGQTVQAIQAFDDGTRLLKAGDFQGAVHAYAEAEALNLVSGPLYYNRAVAHYRLDEIGRAVQYFERAGRLLDDQVYVRHSLDIISARLVDSFSELPLPIWKRFQRSVVSGISVATLIWIGLAFYVLFCTSLFLNVLRYFQGAWFRRARLFTALLAFLFLAAGFSSSIWPANPDEAAVLAEATSLLEQPDDMAETVEAIHEGLVVGVLSEVDNWALVQLPNGVRGWMRAEHLGVI